MNILWISSRRRCVPPVVSFPEIRSKKGCILLRLPCRASVASGGTHASKSGWQMRLINYARQERQQQQQRKEQAKRVDRVENGEKFRRADAALATGIVG